jgi:hypothetical protein
MIAGPDVKKGAVIPRQRIIDEAPTFAKIFGFDLPDAKGTVLKEILK